MSVLNQELLAGLDLKVLTIQRTEAGRWWNFNNVISPFSRLWLVMGGRASVRHHGRKFVLRPGQWHLVPAFTVHDCSCASHFNHYHLHFAARLSISICFFTPAVGTPAAEPATTQPSEPAGMPIDLTLGGLVSSLT